MNPSHSTTAGSTKGSTLVWAGSALGIAACIIGLGLFLAACFGLDAAFILSPLPTFMGAVGLILVVIGALGDAGKRMENVHVLAAIVVPIWGLLGGLVLMAAWLNWPMFYR
jgi:hypothetical protein